MARPSNLFNLDKILIRAIIVQILYLDSPAVDQTNEKDLYRIGTVASLTGISVERLRAWERRYAMSPAHKAGKTRFYSKPQLDRLKLIKHLIDQGQPISSLAALTAEQLQERIADQEIEPVLLSMHAPKVGLVGPNLIMLEQQAQQGPVKRRIEVVSRWANMDAFIAEQSSTDEAQILILQLPVLSIQAIDTAKELMPKARIVVVYQFATAQMVSKVQKYGSPTLKWPISWSEIEHTAISESGLSARSGRNVPRRFSDEELIAIAAQSEDPTHCPEYLIEAINQLNAFATYADDCAQAAENSQAYRHVQADATQARAQLELALDSLITTDAGIAAV
jgi:DNA-binding transcriptional MerR regulator